MPSKASPAARGLFHKAIAQGSYGIPSHPRAKAIETGGVIAKSLGLVGRAATPNALRALPAERFGELGSAAPTLAPSFVVGDAALPAPILETFRAGRQAAVPLVIGSNSDEASVATAFGLDPAALLRKLGAARILVRPLFPGVPDEALKTVCTPGLWAHYLPVARGAVPPEIWAGIVDEVPSLETAAAVAA